MTLRDLKEEYELDCKDVDEINRIFLCVMMDHPEIFWVSGYVYTRYTRGDVLEAMGFRGAYSMDPSTISSRQASIDAYVNNCLAGMPDGDDYIRIRYVYEYIIRNTVYDTESSDNQNICSVFINGRSVCQGYAKATQYLLSKVGIPCTLVTGTSTGAGNHAWNLVKIGDKYYHTDLLADVNYYHFGFFTPKDDCCTCYKYFLKSTMASDTSIKQSFLDEHPLLMKYKNNISDKIKNCN